MMPARTGSLKNNALLMMLPPFGGVEKAQDELRACKETTYAFWTPIHPRCLRCSAVKYSPVFSLLAPWQPGASTTISAQVISSQTLV
jgi:hypothetical protein